jgi:RNA polymerase sigma factor (sigma-70 family)
MQPEVFRTLLEGVRARVPEAVRQFVRTYEPFLRRLAARRLTDPQVRRVVDVTDVCQSVLAEFLIRLASGHFRLETEGDLHRLLGVMIRNRVRNSVRNERAACRDCRRREKGDNGAALREILAAASDPCRLAAGRELVRLFFEGLTAQERAVMELRAAGREWSEIAAELGGTPEGLRKRFVRARQRHLHRFPLDVLLRS